MQNSGDSKKSVSAELTLEGGIERRGWRKG